MTLMERVCASPKIGKGPNINKPDDLDDDLEVEDEVIDKENAELAEVESDVVMNQRRDEIAKLI